MSYELTDRDPTVAIIGSADAFLFPGARVVPGISLASGTHVHDQDTAEILHRTCDGAVKLMPINVLGSALISTEQKLIDGLAFAKDKGADIVQMIIVISEAWGLPGWDQPNLFPAFRQAIADLGMLVISGAGNVGPVNVDETPTYPAEFAMPNQIIVGGTDEQDVLQSNYGSTKVHIAAPGWGIDKWSGSTQDGSSYATPQVTALAAILWSLDPELSVASLRASVLTYADDIGIAVKGGRRLSAFFPALPAPPPPPPGTAWRFDATQSQYVDYGPQLGGLPGCTVAVRVKMNAATGNHQNIASQWNYGASPRDKTFLLSRSSIGTQQYHMESEGRSIDLDVDGVRTWGNSSINGPVPTGGTQWLIARVNDPISASSSSFCVGSQHDGGNYLSGDVEGMWTWNVPLSDAEMAAIPADPAAVNPGALFLVDLNDDKIAGTVVNGPLARV